jgi:hypothetical protein
MTDLLEHPFAAIIIKSVIGCYVVWGTAIVVDLGVCEYRKSGNCQEQRSELRNAATTIPATLLAWLADSPLGSKNSPIKTGKSGRTVMTTPITSDTRRKPDAEW